MWNRSKVASGSSRQAEISPHGSMATRGHQKPWDMAPGVGLEPTTFGLTVRCSAELSYPGWLVGLRWYQSRARGGYHPSLK